ncbi:MAG: hypothetical protein CYPHOPRED_005708 [Cyphobasidiales sp. Tagirdzhanova-0007]|nr:MAG: hypothetical protein CYPHOPRED_005708 [Cyphobasidiales sp. Tagirdzhanova-0007]
MVRAIKGVLITTDPPVKQLIKSMDEEKHFIIQDLDDTHLLVSADSVNAIKEQLEDELEKNTFVVDL